MTMKRFTFAGLMSAVICALMLLLGAPTAHAQVAAQDSVLLDPFDPVPEIQFRHFGGYDCWDSCGGRDCDGCGRCNDGCGRSRCYRGCNARPRCWRDGCGRLHCTRGCRNDGNYDRGARFDHDAAHAEHDHYRYREDERRFHHDAHEYERDNRDWHARYGIDNHWDADPGWNQNDQWDYDRHNSDGAALRHDEHAQEWRDEKREERHEERAAHRANQNDDGDNDDDDDDDYSPPARH